ncbi:MAG: hypothetical protein M3Y71_00775 [Actinomycetota bacterium]|nr:hypothetical protein [Actinomycetota bacterium]
MAGSTNCGPLTGGCAAGEGGIDTSTDRKTITDLPKRPGDNGTPAPAGYKGPRYEYATTTACALSDPGGVGAQSLCTRAITACTDPARGLGPLTRIWRRTVQGGQPPSGWTLLGVTCWADAVPGGTPRPTMADILKAFHTTPWSEPQITTQPVGNTTLVGLPAYYQVNWTPDGYEPGETDTLTLLGYQVQIRPRLDHFTYVFGDGETFGPTTETGGVYPTGTITHPYLAPGSYGSRVDTTFAADFRVNGGQWAPIPDTVTVAGPTTTVTVRTATNHLVAH